jgi:Glyoxalase-like domain
VVEWQLTVDCTDAARMVAFWATALGYDVKPPPPGHATWNDWYLSVGVSPEELDLTRDGADRIQHPTGAGPDIWFQQVPEVKAGRNRLHLDIYPNGHDRSIPLSERRTRIEETVVALVEAGATVLRRYPADFGVDTDPEGYFVVMGDPEGNEYCVG